MNFEFLRVCLCPGVWHYSESSTGIPKIYRGNFYNCLALSDGDHIPQPQGDSHDERTSSRGEGAEK
jgi:hypothetical protein